MPILTPCDDAGADSKTPHAATAANNPDFIFCLPGASVRNISTQQYFITLQTADQFQISQWYGAASSARAANDRHPAQRLRAKDKDRRASTDSSFRLLRIG